MFLIYSVSTFCLAYLIFSSISKKLDIDSFTFNFFFNIKFIFLLLYIYGHYGNFGTDALAFYENANKFNINSWPVSDNLIYGINYFFKNYFYLDFESLNIISFFISFSSCLIILYLTKKFYYYQKLAIYFLLLFPSLNFFTTGINKDMLIFFNLSLFLLSLLKKNNFLLISSIFLSLIIRPYVCFAILISFLFCGVLIVIKKHLFSKIVINKKFFIYLFFLVISLFIIYYILDNFLGSFGKYFLKGNINQIIYNLQSHYVDTALGIPNDIALLKRYFNYIFFPTIFHSIDNYFFFSIILYFESFLILIMFFLFFYNFKFSIINSWYLFFGIMSFVILFLILATVTSNYGIAIRQKWMTIPFILILISKRKKSYFI